MKNIVFLPDIHAPFEDRKALQWAAEICKEVKPDLIIQLGDLVDFKKLSRFVSAPEDDSATLEWAKTTQSLIYIRSLFPKMTILTGNHCERLLKKAMEAGIPKVLIKTIPELFGVKGWTFHTDNEPLIVDNIAIMHGDELPGAPIAKSRLLGMNVAQGHTHKSSITYETTFRNSVWAAECGHLADPKSAAFSYAAKSIRKGTQGILHVCEGNPIFLRYNP